MRTFCILRAAAAPCLATAGANFKTKMGPDARSASGAQVHKGFLRAFGSVTDANNATYNIAAIWQKMTGVAPSAVTTCAHPGQGGSQRHHACSHEHQGKTHCATSLLHKRTHTAFPSRLQGHLFHWEHGPCAGCCVPATASALPWPRCAAPGPRPPSPTCALASLPHSRAIASEQNRL